MKCDTVRKRNNRQTKSYAAYVAKATVLYTACIASMAYMSMFAFPVCARLTQRLKGNNVEEFGIPKPEEIQQPAMAQQAPVAPPPAASNMQGEAGVNMSPAPQDPDDGRGIENIVKRQKDLLDTLLKPQKLFTPTQEVQLKANRENTGRVLRYKQGGGVEDAPVQYEKYKEEVVKVRGDADWQKLKDEGIRLSVDLQQQLEDIDDPKNRELLERLSYAESTGGKFRIHENAGTSRAVSTFGLLPTQAIAEVAKQKNSRFAELFPDEMANIKEAVANKDWNAISKITANPTYDAVMAEDYLNVLKRQTNYDTLDKNYRDDALLYAWYKGAGGLRTFIKAKGIQEVSNQSHVKRASIPE